MLVIAFLSFQQTAEDGRTVSNRYKLIRRYSWNCFTSLFVRGAVCSTACCSLYHCNMAFTLWALFEATLLCLNAICVLNEERFLAKVGWASWQNVQGFGEPPTVKSQILNLIRSIRTVARIPLIFLNIVTMVVKLVLGWENDGVNRWTMSCEKPKQWCT